MMAKGRHERAHSSRPRVVPYGDAESFRTGKLWSLWDMLTLKARPFANLVFALARMQQPLNLLGDQLPPDAVEQMNAGADNAAEQCDELGLAVSAEMARKGLKDITSYRSLRLAVNQFMNTMFIELNNRTFYAPTHNLIKYYGQTTLFGVDVFNKFPSANDDIEEAGTCLALERATACVLHLNRALEVGLTGPSDYLRYPQDERLGELYSQD
jgi:hypothetical protein